MTTGIFIIVSANDSANSTFKENYCFLKLMSNNGMSTKENTMQLSPQFSSSSSSGSESETKYSSFKKSGKHHKENQISQKIKIKSLSGKSLFFSFFFKVFQLTKPRCGFDVYLRCYVFLKTSCVKDSKMFWCTW